MGQWSDGEARNGTTHTYQGENGYQTLIAVGGTWLAEAGSYGTMCGNGVGESGLGRMAWEEWGGLWSGAVDVTGTVEGMRWLEGVEWLGGVPKKVALFPFPFLSISIYL